MFSYIHNKFIHLLFFGNYFYGICAIALSIEATLQQKYPLNNVWYYVLAFAATVLFYSKAYIMTEVSPDTTNVRSRWYYHQKKLMWRSQMLFTVIVVIIGGKFLVQHWSTFLDLTFFEWFVMGIFPFVSGLYYGVNYGKLAKYNLRNVGWLKPFIIGFTWGGLATVYPIMYYCIDQDIHYELTLVGSFLFIKNFMFVTVLCIMFDIKDYAMDYNQKIKTFVVKYGLRKTLFYIIIPLCIVGLGSFLCYALIQHFHIWKILINTIPFILIITVAYSMTDRRSIFYYLIVIDGLMLVKGICGITAMEFF